MFKKSVILVLVLCIAVSLISTVYATSSDSPYEGVELTILDRSADMRAFDVNSASNLAIQEATGIDIEFMLVSNTDLTTKVNTLLAANNIPDIIRLSAMNQISNYAGDGMFVNLTEAMNEGKLPNFQAVLENIGDAINYYKVDGSLYFFPLVWEVGLPNGAVPYIRGDILDELNLEAPTTFDELYEVLKAFKEYNPEVYPWVTRLSSLQIAYAYGVGEMSYYDSDLGEYASGYTSDRYQTYLEYCHKLYSEGLIDPDFVTTASLDWQEACKNGSAYFTYNNCVFVNIFNQALQLDDPDAYWMPLTSLENPWGERRGQWYLGVGEWQPTIKGYAISADSENINAALYLMDYMYSDEAYVITNWGVEGVSYGIDENGEYYMLQKFIDAVNSGETTVQSIVSGADLGFCTVINDWANRAPSLDETGTALYEFWLADETMDTTIPDPVYTDDEKERMADILSKLEIITADINAFIIGTRPISEWPDVVEALKDAGIEEYIGIMNTALQRITGE